MDSKLDLANFVALDSSVNFTVTPDNNGLVHLSGAFFAAPGERIVLGIEGGQLGRPPEGLIESPSGFYFIYLGGNGRFQDFDLQFKSDNDQPLRMFFRRWYSNSEMYFRVDQLNWDDYIFVLGSCVSRDSFETSGLPLSGYRARFSFSTLNSAPTPVLPSSLESNPSEFQRRMVRGDLDKSNLRLAERAPGKFIVVDFIDERLPIRVCGDQRFTYSPELQATGMDMAGKALDVYSDEYFQLFEAGWCHFMEKLQHKQVILNKVFWATEIEGGEPLPNQELISKQNEKLKKLYEIVSGGDRKPIFIEYPTQLVAAKDHQWGQSPFHFGEDFNTYQGEQLRALTKN